MRSTSPSAEGSASIRSLAAAALATGGTTGEGTPTIATTADPGLARTTGTTERGGRGAYDSAYGTRDDHGYYNGRRDRGTSSLHLPDLFDGSWPSIIILCAGGYACHYFGINPFHAIWMLNMMAGNRGRGRGMRNMGMMGMGYGMMNQQMGWGGQRRRHRGGW